MHGSLRGSAGGGARATGDVNREQGSPLARTKLPYLFRSAFRILDSGFLPAPCFPLPK